MSLETRNSSPPITIVDLGTQSLRLIQVSAGEDGELTCRGHLQAPSQGMRKGAVVSLSAASDALRQAAAALERQTGAPIESIFLTCTGVQIQGLSSEAGVTLTSRSREVTRDDASRALDLARAVPLPDDRQILHVIPQEFVLDRQGGIHEPIGMLASRLQARIYAITVATALKDNLVLAANQAGLMVQEIVFAPLGAAEATLATEDRFTGVGILDLGAGSTNLLLYAHGSLQHAATIPIGGDHFTNDVASGFSAPLAEAEEIKLEYGSVNAAEVAESSSVDVAGGRSVPQRQLCEWLEARAAELARRIHAETSKISPLGAGLLWTGGGGNLNGFPELLARKSNLALRPAIPALITGMPPELASPEWACAVGACCYAHRLMKREVHTPSLWDKIRAKWNSLAD